MDNCQDISGSALAILLKKIAEGDELAFRQLFHCYHQRLLHFAFSLIKTREAAEEIVEDVFIRIWKNRAALPGIQNLKIYLYTATKNTSLNYLSKKALENITDPFDDLNVTLQDTAISPEQIMITNEIFNNIREAVESLPPRCKMIFKLVREDGLKYKEVAEILNISVNTIETQMTIALKRIAEAVRKDFEKFPRPFLAPTKNY
jgi:RNA polymerase sigma-70 factor (family 1)